jgi:hypothetical protein
VEDGFIGRGNKKQAAERVASWVFKIFRSELSIFAHLIRLTSEWDKSMTTR